MRRRRRKRKFTIKFSQIKKVRRWILKRKFLTFCICVFLIFSFFGRCSKSEYSYRSVEELAYLKLLKTLYSGRGRQVDVDSARYPITEPFKEFDKNEIKPGVWNVMPVSIGDHGTPIGLFADKSKTRLFYNNHMFLLADAEKECRSNEIVI